MATLLVVDDSIYIRTLLRRVLEGEGHEVGEAATGAEALERFAELQPELTILDIVMPDRDGLAVLRSLRRIVPSARVLVYSAYSHEEKRREAVAAGAFEYLTKTTDPGPLLASVARALE